MLRSARSRRNVAASTGSGVDGRGIRAAGEASRPWFAARRGPALGWDPQSGEQIVDRHFQAVREDVQSRQPRLDQALLDFADLGSMQPGDVAEPFLRYLGSLGPSDPAHVGPEALE